MRIVEIAAAAFFALLGLRSLAVWVRRPLRSRSMRDHALYALWLTGRIGLWFALAGVFVISAAINAEGRAFTDEWERYRWYLFVPLALAAVQALAGFLLGRSGD